ncbi:MAG: hypothetical protein A4E63_02767 [Syntrophorhabdus sp. PtaU1.Bin050]|nr:MAG: hypothetical protein A4E63_02767 [Syntrophorhabdus sp. PtaU1.Bin050]
MNRTTINIDKIREIALLGIRRTAAFLGLGVNAARNKQFTHYHLSSLSSFQVIPDNLDDKSVAHMKEEFENWIISNGLRELIEGFGLFLDEIHRSCLLMATHKKLMTTDEANTYGPTFKRKGVEGKLSALRTRFSVLSDKEKYFESINQARNCITHRRGIVGSEDLKGRERFCLTWLGFDIYAETPTGERHSLTPPLPKEGLPLKDGGNIVLHFVDRIVEYKLGDNIRISPHELGDICFLVNIATEEIVKSTFEYAKSIGVNITVVRNGVEQPDITNRQKNQLLFF